MSERLVVDSIMTADGEVVQLPTLGPLGPVDAEGGRIPLDTVRLFDAEGRFLKVESYEFSTWSRRWVVHLGSGGDADCVSADVTADAYIEDIKYCPFCGEEL